MAIEIKFDDERVSGILQKVAGALDNDRPLMAQIGELMVERTRGRFREGRMGAVTWAPRKPSTLERYAARGFTPSGPPLTGESRMLSTTISYQARSGEVSWGSSLVQAAVMHFGAKKGQFGRTSRGAPIPRGDIPARPYIGVLGDEVPEIASIVQDWLADAAKTAGL